MAVDILRMVNSFMYGGVVHNVMLWWY